jgi:hypothetical protein
LGAVLGSVGHYGFHVSLPVWGAVLGLCMLGLDVLLGHGNQTRFLSGLFCGILLLLWG